MGNFNPRLVPCKLCGHRPIGYVDSNPVSAYFGWAGAWCEACGQETEMRADRLRPVSCIADDGEFSFRLLAAVEDEVVRRWNTLNRVSIPVSLA